MSKYKVGDIVWVMVQRSSHGLQSKVGVVKSVEGEGMYTITISPTGVCPYEILMSEEEISAGGHGCTE